MRHSHHPLTLSSSSTHRQLAGSLEPRVTVVEGGKGKRFVNFLDIPYETPWCGGKATVWPVGHDLEDSPACLQSDGTWKPDDRARLHKYDPLNYDYPFAGFSPDKCDKCVDRHQCVSLYINDDDLLDIACFTAAYKGEGVGFSEIYLTNPDGTTTKVRDFHGLRTFPTLSTREVTTLHNNKYNASMIFVGTNGKRREDNQTNLPQVFLHTSTEPPYFRPLDGPWLKPKNAHCAITTDYNRDGLDDILTCDGRKGAIIFLQKRNGSFRRTFPPKRHRGRWLHVRVEDVTGDGLTDLIIVKRQKRRRGFRIIVYEGLANPQTKHGFNFTEPYFVSQPLFGLVKDIEVLDVNSDGSRDIYIVISGFNEYCTSHRHKIFRNYYGGFIPPNTFVPPSDEGRDALLVGTGNRDDPFDVQYLSHSYPGCGFKAKQFRDERSLLLAQGGNGRYGYTLLLEW